MDPVAPQDFSIRLHKPGAILCAMRLTFSVRSVMGDTGSFPQGAIFDLDVNGNRWFVIHDYICTVYARGELIIEACDNGRCWALAYYPVKILSINNLSKIMNLEDK